MAKVKYQKLGDIDVCLSKGGKRQYFCPNCGSGHIRYYELNMQYFQNSFYKPARTRLHCDGCNEHVPWSQSLSDRVEDAPKSKLELAGKSSDHLTYERNHEPHEQGIWFDYTGFRFKDWYDIELFDGTIVEECRPNGNGWYGNGERDTQVKRIRLKPDSELDSKWHFTGQERIDHNLDLFDRKKPLTNPEKCVE